MSNFHNKDPKRCVEYVFAVKSKSKKCKFCTFAVKNQNFAQPEENVDAKCVPASPAFRNPCLSCIYAEKWLFKDSKKILLFPIN